MHEAPDHLAGEDDEIANRLSGGRSSLASVERYIASCQEHWRSNGPIRAFGAFDRATNQLVGSVEANLALPILEPNQANVSCGVFSQWRGKGIAVRALHLIVRYLKECTDTRREVLRIEVDNVTSRSVAEKAGFQFLGLFKEGDECMARYARDL
jgi:RimJ/RimL family protein N-acetyltransferase